MKLPRERLRVFERANSDKNMSNYEIIINLKGTLVGMPATS